MLLLQYLRILYEEYLGEVSFQVEKLLEFPFSILGSLQLEYSHFLVSFLLPYEDSRLLVGSLHHPPLHPMSSLLSLLLQHAHRSSHASSHLPPLHQVNSLLSLPLQYAHLSSQVSLYLPPLHQVNPLFSLPLQ